MKKSLIFAGILAIGFANAQEGNVGINTDQPKATLDIQPNATNLVGTTNQGILAPRLSKTRVANIETPVQGTLVYVLDENSTEYPNSLISAYTGADTKVAKITEKGYYFYNGTEWVKVQYKDTNDAEWVYDDTTKRINLKRSGQATGFVNKVYYDVQTGAYKSLDFGLKRENGIVKRTPNELNFNYFTPYNIRAKSTSSFENSTNLKYLNYDLLDINTNVDTDRFISQGVSSVVLSDTNVTAREFQGINNSFSFLGSGKIGSITNLTSHSTLSENAQTDQLINTSSGIYNSSKHTITDVINVYSENNAEINTKATNLQLLRGVINIKRGANVTNLIGTSSNINIVSGATANNLYGQQYLFNIKSGANVQDSYGLYIQTSGIEQGANISKMYGLYLQDIDKATTNYSIYTGIGQVRFGDLADTSATTDRTVVVDKDGVLKVGSAAATTATNGVQTQSGMTCTAENAGKINYTTIQKDGKDVGVFGFCMQKGTDYVWAYMLGGSNIYGTSANGAAFGDGL